MMTPLVLLVWRDLALQATRGAFFLPILFFALVALLFPFALSPDPALLRQVAGGALWVTALLAALLPIDRLFADDHADGTLDQYRARGFAPETLALTRMLAHWVGFAPPILAVAFIAAGLLGLPLATCLALVIGLAIGTPALASLGIVAAALTLGLRGAGGMAGLLILPLAIPVLIFGAGLLDPVAATTAGRWLAATSLFLVALGPVAAGAALRTMDD